jgi:hypothetical protein
VRPVAYTPRVATKLRDADRLLDELTLGPFVEQVHLIPRPRGEVAQLARPMLLHEEGQTIVEAFIVVVDGH